MAAAFDTDRLPTAIRPLVTRALEDVDACEEAIAALDAWAVNDRSPDVLVALALLTYHEAAELVLSDLEPASERALALLDEAERAGAERTDGLARLRQLCRSSLARERRRERRLAMHAGWPKRSACDAIELAHRAWRRGDDALAAALSRVADTLADALDDEPSRAAS